MEKPKFKIGDRVRIKNLQIAHANRVGVIITTQTIRLDWESPHRYWINFLDRPVAIGWRYSEHELELELNALQKLKRRYAKQV